MSVTVLIAHAPGEEHLAEELAAPLERAGYRVGHQGTVMVGASVVEEARRLLDEDGPVVLCGSVRAVGTRWARRIVNAAGARGTRPRVFPVRMEDEADVEGLVDPGVAVAEYWRDAEHGIAALLAGVSEDLAASPRFPLAHRLSISSLA